MPNIYRERLTYWAATPDGVSGYIFTSPTSYTCRWEEKIDEFRTSTGEISTSRAVVHVPGIFKDELEVGGYVYRGDSSELDPTILPDAYPIRGKVVVPDLRYVRNEVRLLL